MSNVVQKDIVVISGETDADKVLKSLILPENYLLIGNFEKKNEISIQSNLYVLGFVVRYEKLQGLVTVDKLSGDMIFLKTGTVLLHNLGYQKIFSQIQPMTELYFDPFFCLPEAQFSFQDEQILEIHPGLTGFYTEKEHFEIHVSSLSDEEFEELCQVYLKQVRIIPDLEKLNELHKQIPMLVQKGLHSDSAVKKMSSHLLGVIEDGVERHALEEFSEKSNIYELIYTCELKGSVRGGRRVVTN